MSPMLWGDLLDEYPQLPRRLRSVRRHGFYLGFVVGAAAAFLYLWWLA